MTIVYKSNTGFTRQYAEMLAKAEKLKVLEAAQALESLEPGAEVLYMGPLMSGHISGIDQAVKRFTVKGACAVGMTPPEQLSDLGRANYVPGAPVFYLHGGWDPKKVGWVKRRMVNMATKGMRERLAQKRDRTPQEQAQLDMLEQGGSMVAFQNLKPIQAWLSGQS